MNATESLDAVYPKARVIGLLAACCLTLLSIWAGHEPETVLYRAVIGGSLLTVAAKILMNIMHSILSHHAEEDF